MFFATLLDILVALIFATYFQHFWSFCSCILALISLHFGNNILWQFLPTNYTQVLSLIFFAVKIDEWCYFLTWNIKVFTNGVMRILLAADEKILIQIPAPT